jgi:putative nucleotidyltransferase with HDIG domain
LKRPVRSSVFRVLLVLAAGIGVFPYRQAGAFGAVLPLVLFLVAIAGSDALSVSLPQGGRVTAAVGMAVAAALLFPAGTAVLLVLLGGIVGLFLRTGEDRRRAPAFDLAARLLALEATLPILSLGRATGLTSTRIDLVSPEGLFTLLFVLSFCAVHLVIEEISLSLGSRSSLRFAVLGFTSVVGPIYAALGALGLLVAAVYPSIGPWSLLLVTGLLLVVRYAFNLYTALRGTYRETITALAEAIEAQDHLTRGHAERTADVAVQIARQLGISGKQLETISYAALLHDIGRLAASEDSLDVLMDAPSDDGDEEARFHAVRGAEILGQVDYLKTTAALVLHHHDRFFGPRTSTPLGSRIIKVASSLDHMTHPDVTEGALTPAQALLEMKQDRMSRYDPRVVRALETLSTKGWLTQGTPLGTSIALGSE